MNIKSLTVSFLMLSFFTTVNVFGQYRRFSVGMNFSTNSYYTKKPNKIYSFPQEKQVEFSMYGMTIQYNFPTILSLALEPAYEDCTRNSFSEIYVGNYADWLHRYESSVSDRLSIPLMAKATFGNRFLFIPALGFNYSALLPSSHYEKTDYSIYDDYQEQPLNQVSDKVSISTNNEFNIVCGMGLGYQWNEHWVFTIDSRFFLNTMRFPQERDEYSSYPRGRLIASVAYSFNRMKESTYRFTTYSLRFETSKTDE